MLFSSEFYYISFDYCVTFLSCFQRISLTFLYIKSWGRNQNGQLGLGNTEDSLVPRKIQAFEVRVPIYSSSGIMLMSFSCHGSFLNSPKYNVLHNFVHLRNLVFLKIRVLLVKGPHLVEKLPAYNLNTLCRDCGDCTFM